MLALRILTPQEIRIDETPTQSQWSFIPLYKILPTGAILSRHITFDGKHLEIVHESKGREYIDIPLMASALIEARRLYKIYYLDGYLPAGPATPPLIKGMKGVEYKEGAIKSWPVYTQPKYNGIRMLCQDPKHGRLSLQSWLGTPYTHLTHIEQELREFFIYLPRYAIIDGELYNHNFDFATLISAIKTTTTVHPALQYIQYVIFDIHYEDANGAPFEKRCTLLMNAFQKYTHDCGMPHTFMVSPTNTAYTHLDIMNQHNAYVTAGYEGIMIKKLSNGAALDSKIYTEALYRPGKNNHILKYKAFTDEEAQILSVEKDIIHVRDSQGHIFPLQMRIIVTTQATLLGKNVTFRYQGRTPEGIPISPIGIAIRDYE